MEDSTTALALVKSERAKDHEYNAIRAKHVGTDSDHFQAILNFISHEIIPPGHTFETFSRVCSAYSVINGYLHKGSRNPKRVITDNAEKNDVLYHFHIDQSTGLHKSVEDTANGIQEQFYWRLILQDTRLYINDCSCLESSRNLNHSLATWSNLELTMHGPFQIPSGELRSFATLCDTATKWIVGKVITNDNDIEYQVGSFIFSSMCQYGFPQRVAIPSEGVIHGAIVKHFEKLSKSLQDVTFTQNTLHSDMFKLADSCQSEISEDLVSSFAAFVSSHSDTWVDLIDIWLFQKRTLLGPHLITSKPSLQKSPFFAMFQRDPGRILEKKQAHGNHAVKKRRKLKNSLLNCRHCEETFTSKISFKIHQQRHLAEARRDGTTIGEKAPNDDSIDLDGIDIYNKNSIHKKKKAVLAGSEEKEIINVPSETTINAVKTLMSETKDERGKRGKYFKYSPELREQIAEFAQKHGSLEAANHFSTLLGNPLSESTIRNFVKAHQLFSSDLKEEIGKHAYQFGLEASLQLYKQKMPNGVDLRRSTIKALKDAFLSKHPDLPADDEDEAQLPPGNQQKQVHIFEPNLKVLYCLMFCKKIA